VEIAVRGSSGCDQALDNTARPLRSAAYCGPESMEVGWRSTGVPRTRSSRAKSWVFLLVAYALPVAFDRPLTWYNRWRTVTWVDAHHSASPTHKTLRTESLSTCGQACPAEVTLQAGNATLTMKRSSTGVDTPTEIMKNVLPRPRHDSSDEVGCLMKRTLWWMGCVMQPT
jgi:hypothetical protein